MKQIKILSVVLTLLMGVSFTSCLDSDNDYTPSTYVTVVEDWLGGVTLLTDDGYVLSPSNPSSLKTSGEYWERAYVAFQLAEGETLEFGKTINVTLTQQYQIGVKDFCNPDTLTVKPGNPFISFAYQRVNSGYLTVGFTASLAANTASFFDVYTDEVKDNVLYLRMNQNKKSDYTQSGNGELCFRMPAATYIYNKYPELEPFDAAGDSIKVRLIANGEYDTDITSKEFSVKLR